MSIPWDKSFELVAIVLGSGGVLSMLYAKRDKKAAIAEREAATKEREANADLIATNVAEISQKVYQGIIADLRNEVEQLRNEVFMLRKIMEAQKKHCAACPNNLTTTKNKK